MPFLILFVLIPLIEIYAFIEVGGEIGIIKTLLLCVLTAIIGGFLVKYQGLQTLMKAKQNLGSGVLPVQEIFDGICLIAAGALLMTPGFFTDIIGFLLLTPYIRQALHAYLGKNDRFNIKQPRSKTSPIEDDFIEGDYEEVKKDNQKLDRD